MDLQYDSLNSELWQNFPILRTSHYIKLISGIDAGPYLIFGVIFNKYLVELAGFDDLTTKSKAAAFMEKMAQSKDQRVTDLLISEVLPTLVTSQQIINAYWSILGTSTQRRVSLLKPRLLKKIDLPPVDATIERSD